MEINKAYQYAACLACLMLMLWGAIDITSGLFSAFTPGPKYEMPAFSDQEPAQQARRQEPSIDEYYQKKIVIDRMSEGASKILIPGIVFAYFSLKLRRS
jgi:hypothetical protein